jgi:2-amino-4-hydroxy-6-hydroxymethyldihydropteridine diphosphokinase
MAIECHCGPDALLRRLKMIERLAGPRSARRWGPRALDLDILDYRGRIIRWPGKGKAGNNETRKPLILPHPLLHLRPFVLVPLNDVAPDWRHPVFYLTASQLWSRKRNEIKGRVLRAV